MRARGVEFEKPTVQFSKFDFYDLSVTELKVIAGLLERDRLYQSIINQLYDPAFGGGGFGGSRFHKLHEDRIDRILQYLTSHNPEKLFQSENP